MDGPTPGVEYVGSPHWSPYVIFQKREGHKIGVYLGATEGGYDQNILYVIAKN